MIDSNVALDPISRQLSADVYEEDRRGLTGKTWEVPRPSRDGSPISAIIMIDRLWSGDLDFVGWRLARHNIPVVRLNPESLLNRTVSWDLDTTWFMVDGVKVRPSVLWIRDCEQSSIRSFSSEPYLASAFKANWNFFVESLRSISIRTINACLPSYAEQRVLARSAGFDVPSTVLTNEPRVGSQICGLPDLVVVKSPSGHWSEVEAGLVRGAFAQVVNSATLCDQSKCGPLTLQRFVNARRELRVYVAGASTIAFEVVKPNAASVWTEKDAVLVRRTSVGPDLLRALRRYVESAHIDFAAIDVLVGENERPVYLETNPNGTWWWFEDRAMVERSLIGRVPPWMGGLLGGRPITAAVSQTLRALYLKALG